LTVTTTLYNDHTSKAVHGSSTLAIPTHYVQEHQEHQEQLPIML